MNWLFMKAFGWKLYYQAIQVLIKCLDLIHDYKPSIGIATIIHTSLSPSFLLHQQYAKLLATVPAVFQAVLLTRAAELMLATVGVMQCVIDLVTAVPVLAEPAQNVRHSIHHRSKPA